MTQSNQRRLDQSRHEDYWAKRWAAPLGKYLNVQDVRTTRPNDVATPPDVTFHVRRSNGNETTTWGEITDVYYDETEARLLWSGTSKGQPRMYTEPDAQTADEAEKRVERKLKKYPALVSEQGRGHLLLVISSPLTTRSTRTEMESRVLARLRGDREPNLHSFETVWLAYRLPYTTPEEQEDLRYVFRDPRDSQQFNFIKHIWTASVPVEHDRPATRQEV